ncbi:sodium/hydrogen exchanger 6, partial [Tanacetum coccineum]
KELWDPLLSPLLWKSLEIVFTRLSYRCYKSAMEKDPTNVAIRNEEVFLINKFKDAVKDEELFLKQRSKVTWLSEGDHNTKYFHRAMKERRNSNRIEVVEDMGGNLFSCNEVDGQFVKHFENVVDPIFDPVNLFLNKLSDADAESMVRTVSSEEIKAALFSMDDDKAAGLDGFSSKFFKASWSIMGFEFTQTIKDFFMNGKLLKEINATIIALVPKVKTPKNVSDFRPISCCNVLYKCISKVIANRLKGSFNSLVSSCHNAFIHFSQISDNILLSQELMRNYYRKSGPSKVAFKIDINKSYDSVDWGFLRKIANVRSVTILKNALEEFSKVSGLTPNFEKSVVFFGNVHVSTRNAILRVMPFPLGSFPIRQASAHSEIEKIMRGFLWAHGVMQKGKAKVKWKDVCSLKVQGGLGIKSLNTWNIALMSKHIWNLVSKKDSLWVKWVNSYRLIDSRAGVRNFWDIPIPYDACWSPLSQFISKRDIYEAGLSLDCKVVNLIIASLIKCDCAPDDLYKFIDFLSSKPLNKSIWSIIQRLVLGSVYILWQEKNLRIFQGKSRTVEIICSTIKELVRLRLLSLKVRGYSQALKAAKVWGFNVMQENVKNCSKVS